MVRKNFSHLSWKLLQMTIFGNFARLRSAVDVSRLVRTVASRYWFNTLKKTKKKTFFL